MNVTLQFRNGRLSFALGIASIPILTSLAPSCSDPSGLNTTPIQSTQSDASIGTPSSSGGGASSGSGSSSGAGAGSSSGSIPTVPTQNGLCPPAGAPTATLLT